VSIATVPAASLRGLPGSRPAEGRPASAPRRDLALVAVLLLAAVGLRGWHLGHTDVAARDTIGYVRYAWQLGHHPWLPTIADPKQEQHPGYPVTILAMSYPVRGLVSGPDADVMQLSAQLASCLASVLLVVPSYLLGRDLFGRGAGFWAALLFQCLPAGARVFSDGLSEGVFFLFAATALLGAVRAFRIHSPAWFAVTGACGALAYLTRPEGALIVAATGLVLLAVQCVRSRRAPWRRFLACGAALAVAALIIGSPLYALTGKLTVKPTAQHFIDRPAAPGADESTPHPPARAAFGEAPPFAVWWVNDVDPASSWGAKAVGREFVRGGYYVLWLPLLPGLWWFRDRFRLLPGAWVLLLVSLAILVLMWRVASLLGYVSDRHLLLPLLCGSYWAVAAAPRLVALLAAILGRLPLLARLAGRLPAAAHPVWACLLLAGLAGATLPKTLEPLHANRSGFRDAGVWIADHGRRWDLVLDPYSWSHYYSGRAFLEDESPEPPPGERQVAYLVVEESGREHLSLPAVAPVKRLAAESGHHKVWQWTGRRRQEVVEVVVYEVPLR
jgi:hypothetical protein